MIESEEQLGGVRLEPQEVFRFACHPALACFNSCCAHKRLPLMPYDLLRLRQALGLASPEVLERYGELEADPISGWPALRLRLTADGRCPLLSARGCSVYPHRPTACRIYPLVRAVRPGQDGQPPQEIFLRQATPACLGWQEEHPLTAEQWVQEQGLVPYQQANDRLLNLFFHPRRRGRLALTPRQVHAVILALYNLDVFRQMLDRPGVAQGCGWEPRQVQAARTDDLALLQLGQDWLAAQLFG